MTSKLTITRERVVALIAEHSYDSALVDALEHLLAAMDGEPVGYFGRFDPDDEDLIDQCSKNVKGAFPLYRHAQPAPLVSEVRPLVSEQSAPIIPGWIPVSERMPGSQEWVIVFAKWANQQVLCWDDVQNRWTDFEDQSYYADMFSHWMPLPAAPQEVK